MSEESPGPTYQQSTRLFGALVITCFLGVPIGGAGLLVSIPLKLAGYEQLSQYALFVILAVAFVGVFAQAYRELGLGVVEDAA